MTDTRSRPTRLDPDRLATLEEERDHLLASLEDLERELEAGDIDETDYATLKDDYTARAAEVLRAIAEQREVMAAARPPVDRRRTVAVTVVVLVLAVLAGLLVARSAGQRGGGTLTGNGDTLRERLANCQPLAFGDPEGGIECYQAILDTSPDNVDALTYQGWAYVRAGEPARGAELLDRAVRLDPDYPDARVFLAVVAEREAEQANRQGDPVAALAAYRRAAEELDRFFRNDPPEVAQQVLQQELLELKVFLGLIDPATSRCWARTLAERGEQLAFDQALYDSLGACLDGVLASTPEEGDALVSRAITELGPERQDPTAATALADRALAADPADANALALRASVALATGRLDAAEADLAVLDGLPRPTAAFLIGSPQQLREVLDRARRVADRAADRAAVSTTVPPTTAPAAPQVSVSTVPGAPAIPNPGGG